MQEAWSSARFGGSLTKIAPLLYVMKRREQKCFHSNVIGCRDDNAKKQRNKMHDGMINEEQHECKGRNGQQQSNHA